MRRRINNLYKGMFKGNKTSNIIELHSRKKPPEKSKDNKDNQKQKINLSKYKYANNENDNDNNQKKQFYRNNSPNKKEKVSNLYNNSFSDSDSSHYKSMNKTKLYNKYVKSGTYFKRLRQQVIDKFISGKPLISIERMYNNPEVKKMFGIQNSTEKTNYQSNNSYKNEEEENKFIEEERDRRIPPSKFIPIPNIHNNMNVQYNENHYNNSLKNIDIINEIQEIAPNKFNNMNNLNSHYYHNLDNYNQDEYKNNNKYIPHLFNKEKNFNNVNNNMRFIKENINSEMNNIYNQNSKDIFEYDVIHELNNDFRKKRIYNNENRNNYMIQCNGINEEINNNGNKEFNEVEDINNLLNNLKNANNNKNDFSIIFPYCSKDNDSYFNHLLIKKDKENSFANYFKNKTNLNENTEESNNIRFDTPLKKQNY